MDLKVKDDMLGYEDWIGQVSQFTLSVYLLEALLSL